MKALARTSIMFLLVACMNTAGICSAFFPPPGEVAELTGKEMTPLSSFQAILSFPDYPGITCNLWIKGQKWRQEFVETTDGKPRLVRAVLGTRTSFVRVFPRQERVSLPGLVVWQFSLKEWIERGVDPTVMSYQFLVDRPCLVLGAEDGELHATQYWMDNERHLPVRAIWDEGSGTCDFIWDEWSKIGNFWLPHRIWRSAGGRNPLRIRIRWNGVNIALQDGLFSPQAMDRQFQGKTMLPSQSPVFPLLDACPLAVHSTD
ncbi:hypothetical protein [Desulfoplanes sp.]